MEEMKEAGRKKEIHLKRVFIFLTSLILSSAACSPPAPSHVPSKPQQFDPSSFSGQQALKEVEDFIAVGPRDSGTEGALKASEYLANRLREIGIEPFVDSFNSPTPKGEITFRNVIGIIRGTQDQSIIIASHYDTKSGISNNFTGANDSGSSTGLLLELAKFFRMKPNEQLPGPGIMLVFLDGEECIEKYKANDGLYGSRHMAKTLVQNQTDKKVIAVIVADMIGDKDLSVTMPRNCTPNLVSLVFDSAKNEGARFKFSLAPQNIIDDHVPFLNAGIPAVDIIDFEFGSSPRENDYWHTTNDTFDKLSADSLEIVGRVIIRTVNKLILDNCK